MDISEVRVRLTHEPAARREKLHAYCSVTIGVDFVIRDIKIIEGSHGLFVAMPSRKLSDRCPGCGGKNHLRARFCNDCGGKLDPERAGKDARGRARLHADVAHPINAACRQRIEGLIIAAYREEIQKSRLPGYVPQDLHSFPDDADAGDAPGSMSASSEGGTG